MRMKTMKYMRRLFTQITSGISRFVIVVCFASLLSSCDLVDSNGSTPQLITFPSKQVIFSGHSNDYVFINANSTVSDINGIVSESFTGSLTMDWEDRVIGNPFINSNGIPLVRFYTAETFGTITNNITQYITQAPVGSVDEGSLFLHAMGTNLTNTLSDYWTTDSTTLGPYTEADRASIQMLFSPFETNEGTVNNLYKLFDSCNVVNCQRIADVVETLIIGGQDQLQIISTPLGDFEAYRIDYTYNITPVIGVTLSSVLDFRVGCHSEDLSSPVSSTGTLFINPDVGLVRIDSRCTINNVIRSYTAVLERTTII